MKQIKRFYGKKSHELQQRHHAKRRLKVLQHISEKMCCNVCGFNDTRALQIDHVEGHGIEERVKCRNVTQFYKLILSMSKEDVRKKYQILCANCNCIKRWENMKIHKFALKEQYDVCQTHSRSPENANKNILVKKLFSVVLRCVSVCLKGCDKDE